MTSRAAEPTTPAISVVVRTLGSARLAEALASLAAQTRRDFEVVVVDMSGGESDEILARFESRLPTLRSIASCRLSRPAALNTGIGAARAPRIAILDDDNLYDPAHLQHLVGGLEETAADYVYTGVRHVTYSPDGRFLSSRDVSIPWDRDRIRFGNFVYATGSAYTRALWSRLGGYDERFAAFEDWDFLIRASHSGVFRHLPVVSGESRKFTGIDGISNFDLDLATAARCMAGLYWKHRTLFTGDAREELKVVSADHCRRRVPARTGFLTRTVAGWRLEMGFDLLRWWAAGA